MKKRPGYSPEVRERAVRLVLTTEKDHSSRWAAITSVASKISCTPETLRAWIHRVELNNTAPPNASGTESERIKALERETASSSVRMKSFAWRWLFCPGGARPQTETLVHFVDAHKSVFGIEPICKQLQIAPSTYYRHKQLERLPELRSSRTRENERLAAEIQRVWYESDRNYGARKIWKQLRREGFDVALCTVERLMKQRGIEGVRRGKKSKTTIPDNRAHCPQDLVNRHFKADMPNQLWVADITYVAT